MAQSSNLSNLSSNDTKKLEHYASKFRCILERMGCPYTEGVDDNWVLELIFYPGEHRIRLLQWLFSHFDSKLDELLDPHYASSQSRMDSRIQRLLYVASTLGLCSPDDAELIRGSTSVSHQIAFMSKLLDIVSVVDSTAESQMHSSGRLGQHGMNASLDDHFANGAWFVDRLASEEKMSHLFMSTAKLLPPDITKQIELTRREEGVKDWTVLPAPDIAALSEKSEQLAKNLQRQNEMLQELKKSYPYPDCDPSVTDKVNKMLKLVLSEMSQLIIGFSCCFENELRQWSNRPAPQLNELGPAFKRVHGQMEKFSKLLDGLGSLNVSHHHLCGQMKKTIQELVNKHEQKGVVLPGVASLEQCVDVLEQSVNRINDSGLSQISLNTTHATIKHIN